MNLENIYDRKKPVTKDHRLCGSIYTKCPELANLERQMCSVGGMGRLRDEVMAKRYRVFLVGVIAMFQNRL